jgi:hypothetical protein
MYRPGACCFYNPPQQANSHATSFCGDEQISRAYWTLEALASANENITFPDLVTCISYEPRSPGSFTIRTTFIRKPERMIIIISMEASQASDEIAIGMPTIHVHESCTAAGSEIHSRNSAHNNIEPPINKQASLKARGFPTGSGVNENITNPELIYKHTGPTGVSIPCWPIGYVHQRPRSGAIILGR